MKNTYLVMFFFFSCDCLSLAVNSVTNHHHHRHFDLIGLKSKILSGFCHSKNIIFHLSYISNFPPHIFAMTDHILPFHLILLIFSFRMCARFKATVVIHINFPVVCLFSAYDTQWMYTKQISAQPKFTRGKLTRKNNYQCFLHSKWRIYA